MSTPKACWVALVSSPFHWWPQLSRHPSSGISAPSPLPAVFEKASDACFILSCFCIVMTSGMDLSCYLQFAAALENCIVYV